MYEFDAVSVSSAEAGSLAQTLTEKSADGWDVVAVVPAGSDVVAYLRRAVEDETAAAGPAEPPASSAADLLGSATSDDGSGWAASGDRAAATAAETTAAAAEPAATATTTSAWTGSSQQAAATPPAASPQVPAGWYADPAGRYELRYWDGGAWTEHVSRSGQQFTDPPIP